jgi:hypothetical protein
MSNLVKTIGSVKVYREDNALIYIAGMAIDADGDEKAYAPAESDLPALDYLGNAGSPGDWWGITTDENGQPHIQQSYHLAPGYYVSCTAMEDSRFPQSNPQRFLDSSQIPFFVLPSDFDLGEKLGDYGLAYNTRTMDNNGAIYADIGPKGKLGEGSIALARSLGLNADPKTGGAESHMICYWFVPGSGKGWQPVDVWWPAALNLFNSWGGLSKLKTVIKEIS